MKPAVDALSFLLNGDARFLSQLYRQFLQDPATVDPSFAQIFREFGDQISALSKEQQGPSWKPTFQIDLPNPLVEEEKPDAKPTAAKGASHPPATSATKSLDEATLRIAISLHQLVDAFRRYGHFEAQLDPLGRTPPPGHPQLSPDFYGLSSKDLEQSVSLPQLFSTPVTGNDVLTWARTIYCQKVGYDFSHLMDTKRRLWLQDKIEQPSKGLPIEQKTSLLEALTRADLFERFLHVKFPGAKRFGLEGGDSMIPLLETVLGFAAIKGVQEAVIGMAHRGRLNVLTNVMGKPYGAVFSEFKFGVPTFPHLQASGDVKYHLGASTDRDFCGHSLHLTLMPNPSHLEAVNPVVLGKVRSRQDESGAATSMAVLIHGDAAFSGQGSVAETFAMSQLEGYTVGGTYHIIINNQIGFTTDPSCARSSTYTSDLVRGLDIPVFHVNGDDPEAVQQVGLLAAEYRHTFGHDVVIDLVCYRRHGHNEGDEPAFTQPQMYACIAKHPILFQGYGDALVQKGEMSQHTVDGIRQAIEKTLSEAFAALETYKNPAPDWLQGRWAHIKAEDDVQEPPTSISQSTLATLGSVLTSPPQGFLLNPKIERQLEQKRQSLRTGQGIDWATGEALALASLLDEGMTVRLSGQDCERGTFSHRHAVWIHQQDESRYTPLAHIKTHIKDGKTNALAVVNSLLSEAAVMGFEYGYAYNNPQSLVMWEGQFGDFCNGAQVYIDQFISAGESKWLRKNGLVLLLPHGFEGQGPEHSSARLERFLQLCAQGNMRVVNCTAPANYFHALRRQLHSQTRKPLIVMTPKSLLRHKLAVSTARDFTEISTFSPIIVDAPTEKSLQAKIERVILCSGKVYYDLFTHREQKGLANKVALIRLEQLYPFPQKALVDALKPFSQQLSEEAVVWCQEEPANMGGWRFVVRPLMIILEKVGFKHKKVSYAGRPESASPAVGSDKIHTIEQQQLVDAAFAL